MRISFNSTLTQNVTSLFDQLVESSGDQLIISTGYLHQYATGIKPEMEPFLATDWLPGNAIIYNHSALEFVVGVHMDTDVPELKKTAERFIAALAAHANSFGIRMPKGDVWLIRGWHAKMSMKFEQGIVHAAIIGSSNLTRPALAHGNTNQVNIEIDVLIERTDSADAAIELNIMYGNIRSTLADPSRLVHHWVF